MEHHQLWITELLNRIFGKPVAALLNAIGIHPHDPQNPIPNQVAMELVVFLVAVIFVLWLKRRLSVDRPGAAQQCIEMVLSNPMGVGIQDLLNDNVGHESGKYLPMIGSIGLFILLCNLVSLVPGFESPTATSSVPLGCALVVFAYYNWCGIRKHGMLSYLKHFLGPDLAETSKARFFTELILFVLQLPFKVLMLIIETISHLARLLSLTVRLWVNMLVSELLYGTFLGLTLSLFLFVRDKSVLGYVLVPVPLLVPILFIALHVLVGVLQAFVFTLLPSIYLGVAVGEEH